MLADNVPQMLILVQLATIAKGANFTLYLCKCNVNVHLIEAYWRARLVLIGPIKVVSHLPTWLGIMGTGSHAHAL